MAAGDVTDRQVFVIGGRRYATGYVEHADDATYSFDTGLSRIDHMKILFRSAASTQGGNYIGWRNSNTTSENVAGYGGKMTMEGDGGDSGWGADGETYFFEAEGV